MDAIFGTVRAVLLDFDGPVCAAFAGYPSPQITDQMRGILSRAFPEALSRCRHRYPLHALAQLGEVPRQVHDEMEQVIQQGELRAVESATATPGTTAFLSACREGRLPVIIVTNNYEAAVRRYLDRMRLTEYILAVVARDTSDATRMKPHPYLVHRAVDHLGVPAQRCVLVGDSDTDIQAAVTAGTLSIGYANKSGKDRQFRRLGANSVVADMSILAAAVRRTRKATSSSADRTNG